MPYSPLNSISKSVKYILPIGLGAGAIASTLSKKENEKPKARPALQQDTFQKHAPKASSAKTSPEKSSDEDLSDKEMHFLVDVLST